MFEHVEIDCPALARIESRYGEQGEFCSVFFRPVFRDARIAEFKHSVRDGIAVVLQSAFLGEAVPGLGNLNTAAMTLAILNRYEFEGSLVAALLKGSCTEPIVAGEPEARETAAAIVACMLGDGKDLSAFRMDDPRWSALTGGATMSWSYLAHEGSRNLWWFGCFADYY